MDLNDEILFKRTFYEKEPEMVESVVVRSPSTGRRREAPFGRRVDLDLLPTFGLRSL